MKAIDKLPAGPACEALVGRPWWKLRPQVERFMRVVAPDAVERLAGRMAGSAGSIRNPAARDIHLVQQLGQCAKELVEAFKPASPALQQLVSHVKGLAPSDASDYVLANAVLVCGLASAARSLQSEPEDSVDVLYRLREAAHALAQNRPELLTATGRYNRQERGELHEAFGFAALTLKNELRSLGATFAPGASAPLPDGKQSAGMQGSGPTELDADQPPPPIPVEPGLPDFGIRDSSAAPRSQPATAETPDRPRVAAASSMLSPPDADDPLEAPEFHTLNKPPKTPPQAGSLPAKKEPMKETKQGMAPSAAEVRASPAPSVSDSDEDAGQVQFHAGPDGEMASPSRHLSMGAPPVATGPDAPQTRVARPKR